MSAPDSLRIAESTESFRSVIAAGRSALRGAFILNGGSAIGLLTFIARTDWYLKRDQLGEFLGLVLWLGYGALAAVVAAGLIYHAQCSYNTVISCRYSIEDGDPDPKLVSKHNKFMRLGNRLNLLSWLFGWLSAIVFGIVLYQAHALILNHF